MMTKVVPNYICIQSAAQWVTLGCVQRHLGRQIWSIFLVLTSLTNVLAQIEDSFSTQPLGVEWQGDRSQYVVTDAGRLQLNADQAGPAYLSTPIVIDSNFQWEISTFMEFAPSASNKLDIALIADNEDLSEANGLFVRIGESGSDDAVSLYTRDAGEVDILAIGEPGEVASGVMLSLQVKLDQGIMTVSYDLTGGKNYQLAYEVDYKKELLIAGYFGWICTYTSSRADNFFFDDVYAGPIKIDRESPVITQAIFTNNLLCVNFSETIDPASVIPQQSLLITPVIDVSNVSISDNQIKVEGAFELDVIYDIDLIDIRDAAGNGLDTTIQIIQSSPIQPGELLINEILFNPRDDGDDYIEIYNQGSRDILLDGMQLSNSVNGDDAVVSNGIQIAPGTYIVLTPDPDNIIEEYPNHNAVQLRNSPIPRMSNDSGNITMSIGGVVIDAFDYNEDIHLRPLDNVDGISLERISLLSATQDETNWTSASAQGGYGSPGLPNSASIVDASSKLEFSKRQKVVSSSGVGLEDELIVDYKLDKPGYIGTVEVFDEFGNAQGFIFQNESLSVNGTFNWDVRCRDGVNCKVGIYMLSIRLFHAEGDTWEERITVGVSE